MTSSMHHCKAPPRNSSIELHPCEARRAEKRPGADEFCAAQPSKRVDDDEITGPKALQMNDTGGPVKRHAEGERLSFLGRRLPAAFEARQITLSPGRERG